MKIGQGSNSSNLYLQLSTRTDLVDCYWDLLRNFYKEVNQIVLFSD